MEEHKVLEKSKQKIEMLNYQELKVLFTHRAQILLVDLAHDRDKKMGEDRIGVKSQRKMSPADIMMQSSNMFKSRILQRVRKESNF